ncbi:MAG: hypothetical protein SFW36_17825 [Leptolyngbyaceae cyanobacterium bins.59]|nr:hypothetical protein [Leptolyngbyaceae cyanobacterium bins.59]
MANVLTTAQLASNLGITASSLRTYKFRFRERLVEGQHFVKDETGNNTLWTHQGEELIRSLIAGTLAAEPVLSEDAVASRTTPSHPTNYSPSEAASGNLSPHPQAVTVETSSQVALQNLVETLAESIVWSRIESELPAAIERVIARIASRQDMRDSDRLAHLQTTVLPPALQRIVQSDLPALQSSYEAFGGSLHSYE